MSLYRNTCEVCGDTYETDCWEPERCPFCEVVDLRAALAQVQEQLRQAVQAQAHAQWAAEAARAELDAQPPAWI